MTVLTFEALSGDMGAAEEWALLVPLALQTWVVDLL